MRHRACRQRGIALILTLFLGLVATAAIFLAMYGLRPGGPGQHDDARTTQALQTAKEALLAWSANNSTDPGLLPCPENTANIGTATEGDTLTAPPNCLGLPAVGRLPWYALNLGDLRDAHGERLWYVVSPGFRGAPINSDTPAQISVDGTPNRAVALIISPGPALSGQARPVPAAASPPQVRNYLDLSNNDGDASFVTTGAAGQFNDRVMVVTAEELFRVVERRVLSDVAFALREYFSCGNQYMKADGSCNTGAVAHNFFPWAANFSDAQCLGTASIAAACMDRTGTLGGRIPANPSTPWFFESLLRGSATGTTKVRGASISNTNWFQRNGWRELIYYAVDANCTTPVCVSGSVTLQDAQQGTHHYRVVVLSAGRALAGQLRASNANKTSEANYLEGENLFPLDNVFAASPPAGIPYNDIALGVP